MPTAPTFPGLYVEESPSGARTITGAATSITAFVGSAACGPLDTPVPVRGVADYDREFGGLSRAHPMSYAVRHFYENGGGEAVVVRVANDGATITDAQISDPALAAARRGLWALEHAPIFNLLCIPPFDFTGAGDVGARTRAAATAYCEQRRAMYLVDPLAAWDAASDLAGDSGLGSDALGLPPSPNAALYFPRVLAPDPLQEGRLAAFAPSGAVAGVIARTDAQRGVWRAPAGMEAAMRGVAALATDMTDDDVAALGASGVNCLRTFPQVGTVVWGARTLAGADALASEWKYVPVRRLALYLEESLYRGTQWVVFEPNDEPLWARIRHDVGAFMHELFRQGAFQGRSPSEAYFVRCDRTTMTQEDVDGGVVNIVVGFAPLEPAEFVIVSLRQLARRPAPCPPCPPP